MSEPGADRQSYWYSFYSTKAQTRHLQSPSQFAAFVSQELTPESVVFDVGCGNGRDSLFFAELGFKVVALDASTTAIDHVRERARDRGTENIEFICGNITSSKMVHAMEHLGTTPACIYARFFLHAITLKEQDFLFDLLASRLNRAQRLAFEFRTTADRHLEKVAPPHYRRYQDASAVIDQLEGRGFRLSYQIEGRGFAKYKTEDAIVSRCLFEKA